MCGVFAFVSRNGQGPSLKTLKAIATATEARGPHAFGFSWIDSSGRLRCFKSAGRITDHLSLLTQAAEARLLIGHCRYATHGQPEHNINNHPHPSDGGWIVHNGVIRRYQQIIEDNAYTPVSDCDSELLALMIEDYAGTLVERCIESVREAGPAPLVLLGLWNHPQRLIAVRSGNPLVIGETPEAYWLASLSRHVPGKVKNVPDCTALTFRLKDGAATLASEPFEHEPQVAGRLF